MIDRMKTLILIICLLLAAAVTVLAHDHPAKSSAVDRLTTVIDEQGLDAALTLIAELRDNHDDYSFSEQELDALGDTLLDGQHFEAATAVFSLNVEMFPESWNTYFSLARACMYTGEKECSKKHLKIVTDMNPRFWLAEFILSDLDKRLERVAGERERPYRPGEQTSLQGPYLGQRPPGLTAELFAPGIVSRALALNFNCTFSPDGKEFYFNHFMTIMVSRLLDDGWTAPEPAAFTGNHRALEPHISPDGKNLYFKWFRPTPEEFQRDPTAFHPNHGLYVCERTTAGWSEPRYVGYGGSVTSTRDGKVFVSERRVDAEKGVDAYSQIKQATLENGLFAKFEPLGGGLANLHDHFPITSHPCISPDGRTILFDTSMKSGLYAAYRDKSDVWSNPVNLSEHGLSAIAGIATYSPDGKYIFFNDGGDIYWISSEFVERLRPDRE
jgi:hypothetical protein